MKKIFHEYCNPKEKHQIAKFLTIYIAEAHARDEWWIPHAPNAYDGGKACIVQHKTIESRIYAAKSFVEDFNIEFEVVCDSMKDQVYELYNASPERLYVIEKGLIVYQGGLGPFNYNLNEVITWLENYTCETKNNR